MRTQELENSRTQPWSSALRSSAGDFSSEKHRPRLAPLFLACALLGLNSPGTSQETNFDQGTAGTWQKLLKLQTTASILHVTAHPDDEQGDMLTLLSRGRGVRVSLVSLTRGEAGANAIGSELFEELGWVRAEELRLSARYYGLDALYFTRLIDYGYSKTLEEAKKQWGWDEALGNLVRVIRMERPFIVISRFQGNAGDGHGQHQYTGLLAKEAFRAAGDPERFPDQLRDDLRPWQARALYIPSKTGTVSLDTGKFSPWLGATYINVARKGLSLQRSQTSGRLRRVTGPFARSYEVVDRTVSTPGGEDLFDGLNVSISSLAEFLPEDGAGQVLPLLVEIEETLKSAVSTFDWREPSGVVPTLVQALAMTRFTLATLDPGSDAHYFLTIKTHQIHEAIRAALGIEMRAIAQQPGEKPSPILGPVVPGQRFDVAVTFANRSPHPVTVLGAKLIAPPDWRVEAKPAETTLGENEVWTSLVGVEIPKNTEPWRPHVNRPSIHATYYEGNTWWQSAPSPVARVAVRYRVGDVELVDEVVVYRRQDQLPYGYEERELVVLPSLSVRVEPRVAVAPLQEEEPTLTLTVEVRNHDREGARANVFLDLPKDWVSEPLRSEIEFGREGETRSVRFEVRPNRAGESEATVRAIAEMNGRRYTEDYRIIAHRDLETRYQVRSASTSVRGIDLRVPLGLQVGYVMGVGDEVPAGITQLGAEVRLLEAEDLATGDLETFHAVVIGTRAYAVREDLKTHHQRLLDYVHGGGNLVVLYNTPEFQPQELAPFPGELPPRSEEVSEEDAPVEILEPNHRVFQWPNRIGLQDFDGWVEQRGSKFWSQWDPHYQPMLSSHDTGQAPQSGGWLWARYGEGHYTYFAYALHRQIPYGVPGAFRILANLLSLGLPQQ